MTVEAARLAQCYAPLTGTYPNAQWVQWFSRAGPKSASKRGTRSLVEAVVAKPHGASWYVEKGGRTPNWERKLRIQQRGRRVRKSAFALTPRTRGRLHEVRFRAQPTVRDAPKMERFYSAIETLAALDQDLRDTAFMNGTPGIQISTLKDQINLVRLVAACVLIRDMLFLSVHTLNFRA